MAEKHSNLVALVGTTAELPGVPVIGLLDSPHEADSRSPSSECDDHANPAYAQLTVREREKGSKCPSLARAILQFLGILHMV